MTILIRNARTLSSPRHVSILIEGDRISKIAADLSASVDVELDAGGSLVVPTFIEPHIHLDKVLLSEDVGYSSTIAEARTMMSKAKEDFTVANVVQRVKKVIPLALKHGVTIIRTQVDIDPIVELKSLQALNKIRREYAGCLDLQVVANPQEGIVHQEGTQNLLNKALESGADLIGGLPEAELSDAESKEHLDEVFSIAQDKNVDVDVHNDVLPFGKNLEYFLSKVIRTHYQGRASSAHNIALAHYPDDYASKIIAWTKRANINVVTNPCTMMTSGASHPPPMPRGVTRIRELVEAGVNVTYGIDNMVDPFNPFGDFDPLRNGWLLAYAGRLNTPELFGSIMKMVTENAGRMLRLNSYGIMEGCKADINILNYPTTADALRFGDIPRYVIKRGKVLAENQLTGNLLLPASE